MFRGPAALRAAALLVAAQALALLAMGVFLLVELAVADSASRAGAAVSAALVLLAAAGLARCAQGLRDGRRWARSPVLVLQLVAVPVAIGLLQGGRWYVGAPILVGAVAVTVLMFSPGAAAVLAAERPQA